MGCTRRLVVGEPHRPTADSLAALAEALASFTRDAVEGRRGGRPRAAASTCCAARRCAWRSWPRPASARACRRWPPATLVSTGTLTESQPIAAGETWTARAAGLAVDPLALPSRTDPQALPRPVSGLWRRLSRGVRRPGGCARLCSQCLFVVLVSARFASFVVASCRSGHSPGGRPMRKVIVGVSFSLLLAGLGPAFAQQGTSEITGRAMDESGAALPGVSIVVTNEDSGLFREATSSAEGVYHLASDGARPLQDRRQARGVPRLRTHRPDPRRRHHADREPDHGHRSLSESVTVTGASRRSST